MNKDNSEIFVLEDYESEFSYKKNKSNLNITFNRIAFMYFVFFKILIFSLTLKICLSNFLVEFFVIVVTIIKKIIKKIKNNFFIIFQNNFQFQLNN